MKTNFAKFLAATAVVMFASFGASAAEDWKKTWDATLAKAKGQKLVISVHSAEGFAATVQVFQKAFPDIKVEVTEIIPDAMVTRVVGEQKNGVYAWDSMWASASNMNSVMIGAGVFQDLEPFLILPEVKDAANWRNPKYMWSTSRAKQVFIHSLYASTLSYVNLDNAKGVKIEKLEDLLNPKLKGMIGIRDPYRINGGTWTFGSYYLDKGPEFMKRFYGEMDLVVNMNPRQAADAIMRGDLAVGTGVTNDVITRCRQAGGCEQVKELPFGNVVGPKGVAIFKNAPNTAAATIWVNWFLSKAGQQAFVEVFAKSNDSGAVSTRKDVEPFNAQHAKTAPDYANLDNAFIPGTDNGDAIQKKAMDLYVQVKGGPR